MKIGLRVDVDTFRGTRIGVPSLLDAFSRHGIKASIYYSVGPDNMGRHLWRLLKPAFLWKMMRTNAASLYGLDILFKGTFWPGPLIGKRHADIIRRSVAEGHELGLHAWDHHAWQAKMERMSPEGVHKALKAGFDALVEIAGVQPTCSAVPGWKCNDSVLLEKEKFPFKHNSDCRGGKIFLPVVNGRTLATPQIPVSLPTYDECLGKNGVTNENYNDHMLSQLKPDGLNVLTIHAEAEGIACRDMFDDFVVRAKAMGASFVTLGELLADARKSPLPESGLTLEEIPGREGWVAQVK